jgi:DNA-directed RNA polymerase specialized sigma24 family protein
MVDLSTFYWLLLFMSESSPHASPLFPPTRWTLLQKLREGSEQESRSALETLCRAYWYPLYAVARRKGMNEQDAQDATQGFFLQLLTRDALLSADQTRGKLRSLLLGSFDNFLKEQWRSAMRQKRGGGAEHIPWPDLAQAELRYMQTEASCGNDVETLYNRDWARSVLERSLNALRHSQLQRGQETRFEALCVFLTQSDPDHDMASAATAINMNAEAFRVALHRLRQQYRAKIEAELALTLDTDDPAEIRNEMTELFKAFESV